MTRRMDTGRGPTSSMSVPVCEVTVPPEIVYVQTAALMPGGFPGVVKPTA